MSGTALDPTIPLRVGQNVQPYKQPDIFGNMERAAQIRALNNQNALFPGQQTLQQQAITSGDIANQGAQTKLTQLNNAAVNSYIAPAVAKGSNATLDAYTTGLARAQAAGFDVSGALADLHSLDPSDTAGLQTWGKTRLASGLTPSEAVSAALPGATTASNGQSIIPMQTAPALSPDRGAMTPVGDDVPVYPSRGELATRTPAGQDANGNPIIKPLAGVTPANLAGPAAQPTFRNGGRMPPSALMNPSAPHAAAASPDGTVVLQGPGAAASQTKAATDSTSAMQDYQNQGGGVSKQRSAVLDNMLGDVNAFTTGPGASQIAKLREIGGRLGLPVDTSATTAAESFNKLAAQLASAQQGASGSDARLSVAQSANPHADLSPEGVKSILNQLRGNEDYLQARAKLAAAYPHQDKRGDFDTSVAKLDPRAFQYDRMNPSQKSDFLKNMPDKGTFKTNYQATHDLIGQ
jgi:hypothetical protein